MFLFLFSGATFGAHIVMWTNGWGTCSPLEAPPPHRTPAPQGRGPLALALRGALHLDGLLQPKVGEDGQRGAYGEGRCSEVKAPQGAC